MISPKKIAISMISNKKNSINGSKCKIWGNKEKKKTSHAIM
jgi:transposase